MTTAATLSLADIAQLSGVQRPVVTMWRKRPKDGRPFPDPTPDGRYLADEIVDWLEKTGRGNNRDVRRDVALQVTRARRDEKRQRGASTSTRPTSNPAR